MLDSQAGRAYLDAMHYVDESFRARLEEFCKLLAGPPAKESVLVVLPTLSTELHRHFELEERDGYLGEAVAFAPRLSGTAERLLKQHATLAEELTALLQSLRGDTGSEAWWGTFVAQGEQFIRSLVDHERAENELVQDAYEEDIGVED